MVTIENVNKVFIFKSYSDWSNNAQKRFKKHKVALYETICVDSINRLCISGADFSSAESENTYPITVYKYAGDHDD